MRLRNLWNRKPILAIAGLTLLAGCKMGAPSDGQISPFSGQHAPYGPGIPVGPGAPLSADLLTSRAAQEAPQYQNSPGTNAPPLPQRSPAWSFGNRTDSHAASCTHGDTCPGCSASRGRGANPLSRPIEANGLSSESFSVTPASYQTSEIAPQVPCPPIPILEGQPSQINVWPDTTEGVLTRPDEFIFDGGDDGNKVLIDRDWTVRGLDQEDTVAHYDTRGGLRLVEESNRVPIYAPRFGSIRKIYAIAGSHSNDEVAGIQSELPPIGISETENADTTLQQVQPRGQVGQLGPSTFRDRTRGMELENEVASSAFENRFATFEDLSIIRTGTFDQNESTQLSNGIDAAASWGNVDAAESADSNLQVELIGSGRTAAETVSIEEDEARPRLRLVKIASHPDALPGEIIEFTIRFDNIGNETIGNVTILDHLSPRLEVIEGTPQSELDADFFITLHNDTTQILRAEITNPLPAGQGGIVRFKCKVR